MLLGPCRAVRMPNYSAKSWDFLTCVMPPIWLK